MKIERFLLTTNPGIEDIVEQEVTEKVEARVHKAFMNLQGRVLVEIEGDRYPELLKLRSVYHVIRYLGEFEVSTGEEGLGMIYEGTRHLDIPELQGAQSFRVTATRIGVHSYTSIDIQKAAGQALVDKYHKKVDLKGYEIEIIVDVIGKRCWIGVSLTRDSLHKRFERPFQHTAAIKPPLAYAMLRLADLRPGHVLLDPMCGGGTIPIEAAQIYGSLIRIFASDNNQRALEGAMKNAEAAGVRDIIQFSLLDARHIDRAFQRVDRIVTNPPFGVRIGEWETLKPLYASFLEAASRVLLEEGILVIITLRATSFRDLVFKNRRFIIAHERVVEAGGLYPHIFVLKRI